MNPTEACRYMADPANWTKGSATRAPEMYWPGTRRHPAIGPQELARMALSDTAEIFPTRKAEIRREPRPCTVCHEPIAPGTAYVVQGPKHVRCAGPRR